jgi:hypothetical protein
MMLVPLLLLLVGLALSANYAYVLLSRRSRARLALRDLVQAVRPRQQQVHRLVEKLSDASPAFGEALSRLRELSDLRQERSEAPSDEALLEHENALALEMERLSHGHSLPAHPAWLELQELWSQAERSLQPAASRYNAQVRRFNDSLTGIPGKWVAPVLSLEPLPLLRR